MRNRCNTGVLGDHYRQELPDCSHCLVTTDVHVHVPGAINSDTGKE